MLPNSTLNYLDSALSNDSFRNLFFIRAIISKPSLREVTYLSATRDKEPSNSFPDNTKKSCIPLDFGTDKTAMRHPPRVVADCTVQCSHQSAQITPQNRRKLPFLRGISFASNSYDRIGSGGDS